MQGVKLLVPQPKNFFIPQSSHKTLCQVNVSLLFNFHFNYNPMHCFHNFICNMGFGFTVWLASSFFWILLFIVHKSVSKYKLVFMLKAKTTLTVQSTKLPTSGRCMIPWAAETWLQAKAASFGMMHGYPACKDTHAVSARDCSSVDMTAQWETYTTDILCFDVLPSPTASCISIPHCGSSHSGLSFKHFPPWFLYWNSGDYQR